MNRNRQTLTFKWLQEYSAFLLSAIQACSKLSLCAHKKPIPLYMLATPQKYKTELLQLNTATTFYHKNSASCKWVRFQGTHAHEQGHACSCVLRDWASISDEVHCACRLWNCKASQQPTRYKSQASYNMAMVGETTVHMTYI